MTTPWEVPKLWTGKTVAVLASGSSLTQELADSVRNLPCIAVRKAFRRAPWAEMLVSLDGPLDAVFWEESKDFKGLRICGVECDMDLLHLALSHDVIEIAPGHVIHIRNNGLAAIRIAALAGASKIKLLGFDAAKDGHFTHFYDEFHGGWDGEEYPGLEIGLAALIAELAAQGIEVERT